MRLRSTQRQPRQACTHVSALLHLLPLSSLASARPAPPSSLSLRRSAPAPAPNYLSTLLTPYTLQRRVVVVCYLMVEGAGELGRLNQLLCHCLVLVLARQNQGCVAVLYVCM